MDLISYGLRNSGDGKVTAERLSFDLSTVIDDLIESYMHGNDNKVISAVLKQLKKKVTELETVIEKNKT